MTQNIDKETVEGFGREWQSFDQKDLDPVAYATIFADYFHLFPWSELPRDAVGADIGCGSGRWALGVAPRVGTLHLVDASALALGVARRNLEQQPNCRFHHRAVDELPFVDGELDFAYSLGVLHHVPDTAAALAAIATKLKPGAPLLVYLYYALDQRPWWFRALWRATDLMRRAISRLPYSIRWAICQLIAVVVYCPLARIGKLLDALGWLPATWPLAYYRDKPFYVMRTDALDRFGTRLERRFTRMEIEQMLVAAGMDKIQFSERAPYWIALARRA